MGVGPAGYDKIAIVEEARGPVTALQARGLVGAEQQQGAVEVVYS
jgi:hypothetical protein